MKQNLEKLQKKRKTVIQRKVQEDNCKHKGYVQRETTRVLLKEWASSIKSIKENWQKRKELKKVKEVVHGSPQIAETIKIIMVLFCTTKAVYELGTLSCVCELKNKF